MPGQRTNGNYQGPGPDGQFELFLLDVESSSVTQVFLTQTTYGRET